MNIKDIRAIFTDAELALIDSGKYMPGRAVLDAKLDLAVAMEREACAKLIESRKTGANELMDAVRDMEARAIRARSAGEPRTPADTAEIEEMATDAYGIADAMLKAREA
jgi:arginine utilization protein RocB